MLKILIEEAVIRKLNKAVIPIDEFNREKNKLVRCISLFLIIAYSLLLVGVFWDSIRIGVFGLMIGSLLLAMTGRNTLKIMKRYALFLTSMVAGILLLQYVGKNYLLWAAVIVFFVIVLTMGKMDEIYEVEN